MNRLVSRRHARGFTLIELLVSLVAGLIVGLAVVSLSKNVANQFYEEVRANAAENSVRLASIRLRTDLSRAASMSTGNIAKDPKCARLPTGACSKGDPKLAQLSGIRIVTGGSITPPVLPSSLDFTGGPATTDLQAVSSAQPGGALTPDSFAVWGNLTSGDEYFGTFEQSPSGCGGRSIRLNLDDPSLLRILRDPAGVAVPTASALAALTQVFTPVPGQPFMARVTDAKGYYHYALTCSGAGNAVSWDGTTALVNLQNTNAVLTSLETTGKGGVDGFESIAVSPIHGAYWYIGRDANAAIENAGNQALSQYKFDLMRAWVSGEGKILFGQAEMVSEFAVDLKLGFTVDDPAAPDNSPARSLSFGFTATAGAKDPWANLDLIAAAATQLRGFQGPHRIRSVRYRLTTRAAMPDREQGLNVAGSSYLYRYCVNNNAGVCAGQGPFFARTRVTTGEVALVNQARMNY
jgi:prepilin-type N-terminal cleavage/methylation domain-containing protein